MDNADTNRCLTTMPDHFASTSQSSAVIYKGGSAQTCLDSTTQPSPRWRLTSRFRYRLTAVSLTHTYWRNTANDGSNQ